MIFGLDWTFVGVLVVPVAVVGVGAVSLGRDADASSSGGFDSGKGHVVVVVCCLPVDRFCECHRVVIDDQTTRREKNLLPRALLRVERVSLCCFGPKPLPFCRFGRGMEEGETDRLGWDGQREDTRDTLPSAWDYLRCRASSVISTGEVLHDL